MTGSLTRLAAGAALIAGVGMVAAAVAATGARAQGVSNEAWLGQVGGTNTITIDQSGRSNQAGADNVRLRLNQDGNDNVLSITQFGHRNQAGAAPYLSAPTGINQVGGSNKIDVTQRNAAEAFDGTNIIGAIFQRSADLLLESANILTILQSEAGGNGGAAHHQVGTVSQVFTGGWSDRPNQASISQTGGGFGEGNSLERLYQRGTANSFTLTQQDQSNEVVDARQIGSGNRAFVGQGGFAGFVGGNFLEYLHQFGVDNVARVVMQGSNNAVQRILQINAHLGASALGNKVRVSLNGEDNGGTGIGGVGKFQSDAARAVSVGQANVVQLGDYNRTAITIAGVENKFGAQQFGEDNDVYISIGALGGVSAQKNESAVFQVGTDNSFSHVALGSENVGAARQFGDYNRLWIEQRGNRNLAEAVIVGSLNNFDVASFTGLSPSALPSADFRPGRLYQQGLDNAISVKVTGSGNRFGFYQAGNANVAESIIVGAGNQVVVVQIGNDNVSLTQQYGSNNSAIIRQ